MYMSIWYRSSHNSLNVLQVSINTLESIFRLMTSASRAWRIICCVKPRDNIVTLLITFVFVGMNHRSRIGNNRAALEYSVNLCCAQQQWQELKVFSFHHDLSYHKLFLQWGRCDSCIKTVLKNHWNQEWIKFLLLLLFTREVNFSGSVRQQQVLTSRWSSWTAVQALDSRSQKGGYGEINRVLYTNLIFGF